VPRLIDACRIALTASAALALCGCAITGMRGADTQQVANYPHKAVVVQMPLVTNEASLAKLFAPGLAQESPESHRAVEAAVENAERQTFAEMKRVLEQAGFMVGGSEATFRLINELKIAHPDIVVSKEMAERLRAASGADALLRFRITDYGVTPRSWRKGVIVFEVVSTLGIAAVAYAYPATRPLAGIYLVQESIEETAEAYAGFWALDEVARPVRIEAELIELNAGEQVWRDSATGLSDVRLSRMVRKVAAPERDAQLISAARAAAEKILAELRESLPRGRSAPGLPPRN
jgi:hypothetical protein